MAEQIVHIFDKVFKKILTLSSKAVINYIYAHYDEMKELNEMTDESLLLDIDIIEMKYEKALAEKEAALAKIISALKEKDSVLTETSFALAEITSALAEKDSALAEKDSALAEKDLEIELLKAEIAKLKHR